MACARRDDALFFKLNLGRRTGVVTSPAALGRFADVQLDDVVPCVVAGVSVNGAFVHAGCSYFQRAPGGMILNARCALQNIASMPCFSSI